VHSLWIVVEIFQTRRSRREYGTCFDPSQSSNDKRTVAHVVRKVIEYFNAIVSSAVCKIPADSVRVVSIVGVSFGARNGRRPMTIFVPCTTERDRQTPYILPVRVP